MKEELGKLLMFLGAAVFVAGLLFWSKAPLGFFGHLPGDFHIKRENFEFYFPLTTSLFISLLISLILWFFNK